MADELVFVNHRVALSNSAFARLFVFSGSSDDPAGASGLAHLAEHLALKRGKTSTYQDLRLWSDCTKSDFTAYTTKDFTSFELRAKPDSMKSGLRLLADLVFGCSVTEADFAVEKNIVDFERLENRPDAYRLANAELYGKLFDGGPYSGESVGSAEQTRALCFIPFMREFRARYRPENAFLYLCSPFSDSEISSMIGVPSSPGLPSVRPSAFKPCPAAAVITDAKHRFCFTGQIINYDLHTLVTAGIYCRLLSLINRKSAKLANLQSDIDVYLRAAVFSSYFDSRGDEDVQRYMRLAATILSGEVSSSDIERAKRKFINEKLNPESGSYNAFLDASFGAAAFNDLRYRDSILSIANDLDLARIRNFMLSNRLSPASSPTSAKTFPLPSVSFLIDLRRLAPGFFPCRANIHAKLGKIVREHSGAVRPEILAEGRFLKLVYAPNEREHAAVLPGLKKLIPALAKAAKQWEPYPEGFLDYHASAEPIVMSASGANGGCSAELSEFVRAQNERFPLPAAQRSPASLSLSLLDENSVLSRVHILIYLPTARLDDYACALYLKHLLSLFLVESVKDTNGDFYSYHCWTDDIDGRMLLAAEYKTRADLVARTILGVKQLLAGFKGAPPSEKLFLQAREAAAASVNNGTTDARKLRLEIVRAHHGRAAKTGISSLDDIINALAGIRPEEFGRYLSTHLSERCFRHLIVAGRGGRK